MGCIMVFADVMNVWIGPTPLFAQEPTFENFLHASAHTIERVTSNTQAQAFVQKTMGPFIPATLGQKAKGPRRKKPSLPDSLTDQMVTLAQEIAIWHYTTTLEQRLDRETEHILSDHQEPSQAHLSWLQEFSQQTPFNRVFMLAETYFKLATPETSTMEDLPYFSLYAQYLNQTYPPWKKGNPGLLGIAEKEGAQGILQRLQEYWAKTPSSGPDNSISSATNRAQYAARYLHQHYLPYHQAYLQTALLKLQRDSQHHARAVWEALRQWKIDQKQKKGLMRLCGTWQWLIHNHQNHGDHKTVMVYPPPSQYDRMDPKPAKIQVQGDTVFIRWEFPRGIIQEESLLLSEKDRALAGTFVNNMGPNGNITARRVKPCPNN